VWRLVSHWVFLGPFSLKFVFEMIWLLQYGNILETQTFQFQPADFVAMLLFGAIILTILALAIPSLGIFFVASPLVFMLLYVYSRNFPNQQVSIMGLFTVQSFYLPFAFLGITVVMGGNPMLDIMGIVVGHLWWFLTELYPAQGGQNFLATPDLLKQWVANLGIGPPPRPTESTPAGFAAFRGSGRRLGAQQGAHRD
jgi:Derlin-2/3